MAFFSGAYAAAHDLLEQLLGRYAFVILHWTPPLFWCLVSLVIAASAAAFFYGSRPHCQPQSSSSAATNTQRKSSNSSGDCQIDEMTAKIYLNVVVHSQIQLLVSRESVQK